ncbi:cytochrome D1 [Pseudomonas sichuanensis]|uniref:cytochrome D1 domain-containing protein n=1 Tax=Pseudomonas sichuanensis TaxID=2213015 RepID=UPI00244A12C8|nr:cytochrome D1 domain-containing protein [Pseudomonas sichuanensis]MDH0733866.1 cytochrome D1 [Pseudomonas sichuanensis]MDH1585914.1 cytochrome D1 [Pseudomonas sichuanensis]MDH1594858.1 cytochrome D1 [Pseudomonas sichuanensis]MDH1599133.1 cytochrome D1 [Pseudomonas sichuanensis]
MNRKLRPAYMGLVLGWALIGLGVAYEKLWCDPRELLQQPADPQALHRLSRDGVTVEFEARPLAGAELREGDFASIRFKVSDQASGQPLSGMAPGAWLDPAQSAPVGDRDSSCKARVALFLKSSIGARPLLDLNSYFLLVLNKDASLTVIDPTVSVGGVTSTLARIDLPGRPMDWVATRDDRQVFVSMPERNQVALIDTETFRRVATLDAGEQPLRVALQPDQRLLWVGNNSSDPDKGGVTVIDVPSRTMLKSFITGSGHHEIAFSADSRYAFVSNRDGGTLSVIDTAAMRLVQTLKVGPHPLSVAYSALSQAVYVVDGQEGTVRVIDARSHHVRHTVQAEPGLGPMRFSSDGRFGVVLNTLENQALVIDASNDQLIHRIPVAAEPYQLTFTKGYAYVRGLASPKVSMINLASLGQGRTPIVQGFEAGPAAPRQAGDLPLAQGVSVSRDDNSVFVVNPVDNTTYFYAEGMNAPMSGYNNRGHQARAAIVIDRSLREVAPGVYGSTVKLPAAGTFDVAFLLNQPQIIHCFSTDVAALPDAGLRKVVHAEFLGTEQPLLQNIPFVAQVRILGEDGKPRPGLRDLSLRYFLAPSSLPRSLPLTEVGEGVYQASLELAEAGAWYLHVQSPSLGRKFAEDNYTSLRVLPAATAPTASQGEPRSLR